MGDVLLFCLPLISVSMQGTVITSVIMLMFNKSGIVQDRLGAMMKLEAWRKPSDLLMDSGAENDISMETMVSKGENCVKIHKGADDYSVQGKRH